ncbi:MAG TPA: hypothetical protein VGO36_02310 [Solirubrobacterales bacterium]|jgi:hypothetical protein|nr:hypothetical protein [Solirubrobacterales bacterium]
MRRKPTPTVDHDAQVTRFAWWISFFATLTLIAVLGLARSAQAMTLPAAPAPVATAVLTAVDDEGFEGEAEASEDEEFEFGECDEAEEECEEDGPADGFEAPDECILNSAKAMVLSLGNHDKVRLQIKYTTTAPTAVKIAYGLHGGKGSLYLGDEKKQLGRKGVLRLDKSLTETQMAKVAAAKGFTVRLRVAAAPGYCAPFFDWQLDDRRPTPAGLSWLQSE